MTAPGAIQPLNNVPTAPMYFAQSPGLAQQLAPTTRLLLEAIQQHQAQQELARQQSVQQGAGGIYAGLLGAAQTPSALGGTIAPMNLGSDQIGGQLGTVAPITVQPNLLADRVQAVVKNRPGEMVMEAGKAAQNALVTAQAAENKQREDLATAIAKRKDKNANTELKISGVDGTGILVDKNTGKSQLVMDENGKPRIFADPNDIKASRSPRPLGKYTKDGVEYIAWSKPGTTGVSLERLPDGFAPSGVESQFKSQAATRYMTSSIAFAQAKGEMGIPKGAVDYIASQVKVNGTSPMSQWITTAALSDEAKQSLLNWTTILQNTVYKNSGAAVTLSEFNRAWMRIPIQGESKALRDQKLNLTRYDIYSDWRTGRNELARSRMEAPDVQIPDFTDLWKEPGDPSLTPEQRTRAQDDPDYAQFLREKGLWP